jgi:hypothetical protein
LAEARYFRVIFTNSGASTTTSLFLSVVQDNFNQHYAHRLQDTAGLDITFNNSSLDSVVRLPVINAPIDGQKATYSAGFTFTAAGTPTDVVTLTGSATKTIKITRIELVATQTTAAMREILFIRRSTANTGGTTTTITPAKMDTNNPSATAVLVSYSVNPTAVGTIAGTIKQLKSWIPATNTQANYLTYDFGTRPEQAITLRGTTDIFVINLNSATSNGNSFDVSITWTEE